MTKARQQLAGSERGAVEDSKCLGPIDPRETLNVVVTMRRRGGRELEELTQRIASGQQAQPLSREAFAERFSAAPEDIAKLEAFAREYGLGIERQDLAAAKVVLSGTVEQFQSAFGVELSHYEHPRLGRFRGRTGCITIPAEIADIVTAVLGLDNRPQARPHFRLRTEPSAIVARAAAQAFTPVQLAGLYDFPDGDGAGQCIGLIELGGGYAQSDLSSYFSSLGVPTPQVVSVAIDGADNSPTGDPGGPDGEVTLDIEIAGAVAPKAKIAVYFTPNSDAGFVDAVSHALHDSANRPSVLSISWGGPESSWTDQAVASFNDTLRSAMALGVTICAASGDSGSSDGSQSGGDDVDFPASSPYVLACGGTRLSAGPGGSTIASEVVWNDGAGGGASGGGISARFALPVWQEGLRAARVGGAPVSLAKRGVPDVAADASPASGYEVLIDGQAMPVGGTSAVAPLYAGLIARINATTGKAAGFVNQKLYGASQAFNDITSGNNGTYAAASGWDACTGLGSPKGRAVAAALGGAGASGAQGSARAAK
ncbi:peptidase S53 [Trinickia dabaoshanensis]|uniref:Peptidase S53 n=1 Tax=Trinickia dabaoshanensis TaxID=564714 RepID=A0A2N7VX30_9BURK|nr:S53 family peptidase [Trinickia dabaoshanensis]PMS21698.1 peptidase S53 [Trinickia dabaoshanensis]